MDLIEHFDILMRATDSVKSLRELILSLAVRGKLVEQDPNDEPASELLKRIAAEKARLVTEKKIRKPKKLPPIDPDEVPFEVPRGWEWSRLGDLLSKIEAGWSPSAEKRPKEGDEWGVLKVSACSWGKFQPEENKALRPDTKPRPQYEVQPGDFLISRANTLELVARSVVVDHTPPNLMLSDKTLRLEPTNKLTTRFLNMANLSETSRNHYSRNATGTSASMRNVSQNAIRDTPIPLPPLAEQLRIITRFDQLMALCDQLEEVRATSETTRRKLTQGMLKALTESKDSVETRERWANIEANFATLFRSPQDVKPLRQAVLSLAVRGKLVEQDPDDEPASELLKRIAAEKARLVAEKKIRKPKKLPPVDPDEVPFEVPKSWELMQLGYIVDLINGDRGKNYPNRSEYVATGLPFINTGHIRPGGLLDNESMHFITREKYNTLRGGKTRKGDLVYCLRGATLGKTAIVEYSEGAIASSLVIIRPHLKSLQRFLFTYLISPLGRSEIKRFDNGSAQPNLSSKSLKRYSFPLPPLAEQHRIVKRVDELMTLCDQLEEALAESQVIADRLLPVMIRETLGNAPTNSPKTTSKKGRKRKATPKAAKPTPKAKTPKPATPAPPPGPGKQASLFADAPKQPAAAPSDPDTLTEEAQALLGTLRGASEPLSKRDALEASGIRDYLWTLAVKELLDAGLIVKTGRARGTRYSAATTK